MTSFTIVPNPVISNFNVLGVNPSDQFKILNSNGSTIKSFQGTSCNVNEFPTGIYILINITNSEHKKFVKW